MSYTFWFIARMLLPSAPGAAAIIIRTANRGGITVRKLRNWWKGARTDWLDYPLREGMLWNKRYRIGKLLGTGGFGQTYAACDIQRGKRVLLKFNRPSAGEKGRLLLRRESVILKELRHPQIPGWQDYIQRGGREALVTEWIEGDSLAQQVDKGRTFTEREALQVLLSLMRPLRYLHGIGYVHRDVRLTNVIQRDGHCYLVDFGLACRIGEQLHFDWRDEAAMEEGEQEASPAGWDAVEHRLRKPYPSGDLYGAGHLMLFLLYTGYEPERPEDAGWERELKLSPPVREFVRRLLQDEEDMTATDCEKELKRLLAR